MALLSTSSTTPMCSGMQSRIIINNKKFDKLSLLKDGPKNYMRLLVRKVRDGY